MSAHGTISGPNGITADWRPVAEAMSSEPGVVAAAPLVQMEGMIQSGRELKAVLLQGIEPAYEEALSGSLINMIGGNLNVLSKGSRGIIMGRLLALDLGVRIGDGVVLLIPRPVGDGTLEPVLERFIMRGVFEVGLLEQDSVLALINVQDAAAIIGLGDAVHSVRFRAEDVMAAPAIARKLEQKLGNGVSSSDWTMKTRATFARSL